MKRTWSLLVAAFVSASLAWAGETAKTTLKVEGMTGDGCVRTVKAQLEDTEGVAAYEVRLEEGEAVVSYDPAKTTPARIADSVTTTGYTASVRSQGDAGSARSDDALERVTLFQVPLTCPAVKGLGCGGKARPFMAELEEQPEIAEAWLNHPGTVLAIVWKEPQTRARGAGVVGSLFRPEGLSVAALDGPAQSEALQDFAARTKWYRGQDVNRLSEQEGLVFTERMTRRVEARAKLSPASVSALRADLRTFCVEMLLGRGSRDTPVLLDLATKYLDAAQLKAYQAALKEGFQALPGESIS